MWSCAEFACFLCAAVWSWTLNCRKISYSLWWRDCVPQRSPCSPLCPILRRPSAPRPNASPKRRPRNTRAGNSGFCDRRITYTALLCFWSYFQEGSTTECNAPCASVHLLSYARFWSGWNGKILSVWFFCFPPFGTLWMRVLNLVWKYRSQHWKNKMYVYLTEEEKKNGICFRKEGIMKLFPSSRAWNYFKRVRDITGSLTNLALQLLFIFCSSSC